MSDAAQCQDSMCQRRLDRAVEQAQFYRREIERLRAALTKIKKALENGALVPLDGYSDEMACLDLIERALNQQSGTPCAK